MNEVLETGTPPALAGRDVWVVDDALPVDRLNFDKDDLLQGIRPIDRGTLRQLTAIDGWDDEYVRSLCEELLIEARNVIAFTHPTAAVDYMRSGAPIPDAIVFDLKHRSLKSDQVLGCIKALLQTSISVIQVYTTEAADEAKRELKTLLDDFPGRLVDPRTKTETTAQVLAEAIRVQLDKSLSAQLARELRRLSLSAVEGVLVKIDGLPTATIYDLLGGKNSSAEEAEFIELLSVKVSEALGSAPELNQAVRTYVEAAGIADDQRGYVARAIADVVVANVREEIRNGGGLLALAARWEKGLAVENWNPPSHSVPAAVISDFFQFRLYSSPPATETLVTTGDVVQLTKEGDGAEAEPDLHLVLTPGCDLFRFWKKTRGTLTLARMVPVNDRGVKEIWEFKNQKFGTENFPNSITADNPLPMPSVRYNNGKSLDYVLFCHSIVHERFSLPQNQSPELPLSYKVAGGRLLRHCRISEPFLTAILEKIRSVMFRPGIPDFPDEEKKRLVSRFGELKGTGR